MRRSAADVTARHWPFKFRTLLTCPRFNLLSFPFLSSPLPRRTADPSNNFVSPSRVFSCSFLLFLSFKRLSQTVCPVSPLADYHATFEAEVQHCRADALTRLASLALAFPSPKVQAAMDHTLPTAPSPAVEKRQKLNYQKCRFCRKDKKKASRLLFCLHHQACAFHTRHSFLCFLLRYGVEFTIVSSLTP